MISIPACKIQENEKSILFYQILFVCMLYLTCIISFCMQVRSVYTWAWSLSLQVKMYTINYNEAWKMKNNFFLICMLHLTCIVNFYMWVQSFYSRVWSLYLHVISWKMKIQFITSDIFYLYSLLNLLHKFLYGFTICVLAVMISMPMGMFSIPTACRCDVYTCRHDLYTSLCDQ